MNEKESLASLAALKPVPPTIAVLEIRSALDLLETRQHGLERQDFLNEAAVEFAALELVFENHTDVWSSFEEVKPALEAI